MTTQYLTAAIAMALCGTAYAGFGGQTILGPLTNGSNVAGDTTGATDDNDGWTSGDHIFNFWDGGDDVWQLDWSGGAMHIYMTYEPLFGDLDVFLYRPGGLNDSGDYGIQNDGDEDIFLSSGDAVAGTYYIVVDGPAGQPNSYNLSISPAPGAATLFGCAALGALRRRRR